MSDKDCLIVVFEASALDTNSKKELIKILGEIERKNRHEKDKGYSTEITLIPFGLSGNDNSTLRILIIISKLLYLAFYYRC